MTDPLRRRDLIGEARYWLAGDAHWAAVDQDGERVKIAIVGCEPARPLLGVTWIDEWRWHSLGGDHGVVGSVAG